MNSKMPLILVVFLCSTIIQSCNNDPSSIVNPEDTINLDHFLGDFAIQGSHEKLEYVNTLDSMGNLISQELELVTVSLLDTLTISQRTADSLFIDALISQNSKEALSAFSDGDTIYLNYDASAETFVNTINGKIWKAGDQLHLNYRWRKGTDWAEQFPFYGDIEALGLKL